MLKELGGVGGLGTREEPEGRAAEKEPGGRTNTNKNKKKSQKDKPEGRPGEPGDLKTTVPALVLPKQIGRDLFGEPVPTNHFPH